MRWGRKKASEILCAAHTRTASPILIAGSVLCAVFFLVSVRGDPTMPGYPADRSEEAVYAFAQEHTALADILGIDEYFPPDAVPTGAFEEKSEAGYREFVRRQWSFGDYMRDAFQALLNDLTS